jgi:hypothetical protein
MRVAGSFLGSGSIRLLLEKIYSPHPVDEEELDTTPQLPDVYQHHAPSSLSFAKFRKISRGEHQTMG